MSKTGEEPAVEEAEGEGGEKEVSKNQTSPPDSTIAKDTSPIEEVTKELEEEKVITKELEESEKEQEKPEKLRQELQDASKLKIKPTPEAVKQEPVSPEPAAKKSKLEDDIKRWKGSAIKASNLPVATPINDEDYLVNREGYKLMRDVEFATGHRSKIYKCRKDGVEQMMKITPLKNINLRYKANLLKNAIMVMRFLQENQHPSLLQHYAFFQSPIKMYIFMEPLSNTNLHTYLKKNRKPTSVHYLQKVKKFGRDVAEGINHLNVLGIAHCNIKTVNVCLTSDLTNAKIVGFNNSMLIYNPIKDEEISCPKYAEWSYNHAPETIRGNFKPVPADVWSLGIYIVMLLTGKPPFPKKMKNIETRLKAHLHRHFVQPEQTLVNLLMKCFEREPNKRLEISSILLHPFFN